MFVGGDSHWFNSHKFNHYVLLYKLIIPTRRKEYSLEELCFLCSLKCSSVLFKVLWNVCDSWNDFCLLEWTATRVLFGQLRPPGKVPVGWLLWGLATPTVKWTRATTTLELVATARGRSSYHCKPALHALYKSSWVRAMWKLWQACSFLPPPPGGRVGALSRALFCHTVYPRPLFKLQIDFTKFLLT